MPHIAQLIVTLAYLLQISEGRGNDPDYWSEGFDKERNCKESDVIKKLADLDYVPGAVSQCLSVGVGEDDNKAAAFQTCKAGLAKQLEKICSYTSTNSTGELYYCYDRGQIQCCFGNYSCVESWVKMQRTVYKTAKSFLKNPKEYLDTNIKPMGYEKCHLLHNSLDASKCADDCKELGKQQFATNCTKNGGFFKCCIRRDAAFCHECRFCCSLPMCTHPSPFGSPEGHSNTQFNDQKMELKSQKNHQTASELFLSLQHIYKSWDYRCLAPDTHDCPTLWGTYDMHNFRTAWNQESLDNVTVFKHDNMFNNWIDPKVMAAYTENPQKSWGGSYGFQYVKEATIVNGLANSTKDCHMKCIKMEMGNWAKKCKKKGGLFKCCVTLWITDIFENSRNNLIKKGLIKDNKTSFCNKKEGEKDACTICRAEGICSQKIEETGQIQHSFKTKYRRDQKVGGPDQSYTWPTGMRLNWCQVPDLCQESFVQEYDTVQYRMASGKKELCKLKKVPPGLNATTEEEFEKYCKKSKSNIVFPCAKNILKTKNYTVKKQNKMFSRALRRVRRKTKKKRKKKTEKENGERIAAMRPKKKSKKKSKKRRKKKKNRKNSDSDSDSD